MKIVDVQVIGFEAAQTFVDRPPNRRSRQAALVRRVAHFSADFPGYDDAVPPSLERLAEHLLRSAAVVDVGGIEEVEARLHQACDHADRGLLVSLPAESHGPEAQPGYLKAGGGERNGVHLIGRL